MSCSARCSTAFGDGGADLDRHAVFTLAAEIEGHPDNAAAGVYGGFTIAVPGGPVQRLDPHPDLRPVVLVPAWVRLATHEARELLPATVPREDAVFNVAHAALVVHAVTTDPTLLAEAMLDRLHQTARLELLPEVREAFEALRELGIAVCMSGSGPTLLAFETGAAQVPELGPDWVLLRPGVRSSGYEVVVD